MAGRYALFVPDDRAARATWAPRLHGRAGRLPACETAIDSDACILLVERGATSVSDPGDGVILGELFNTGTATRVEALSAAEWDRIAASRGTRLIHVCWGSYIAVLPDRDGGRIDILRSPLGDLPCYYARCPGGTVIGSDVALLAELGGVRAEPDWSEVARQLAIGDLHRPATCLAGVRELQGGVRLSIRGGTWSTEPLWSPWIAAGAGRRVDDRRDAAERVRTAALTVVAARASRFERVVLLLSGGLDSSIVAACLASAERVFSCLNLVTRDRAGDERDYARRTAAAFGAPLAEAMRDLRLVDVSRSSAERLPRPVARSFTQASERLARDAAAEHGADAVFDGGGGDNLFCALQSAAPAADHLRVAGPGRAFLETVGAVGALAQVSLGRVVRAAAWRAWGRSSRYRWRIDLSFLAQDAARAAAAAADHAWLDPPKGALPGSAAHVALLAAAQTLVESADPQDPLPRLSPLVAQPLAEACLSVPSWLWFEDGRDRAVARTAFAERLPRAIVERRSKGAPDGFVAELFEANRPALRAMLLDGLLAYNGLLCRSALADAFDETGPVKGHAYLRIMRLADAEAWARSWCR